MTAAAVPFRDLPEPSTLDWSRRPDGCGFETSRFTIVDATAWHAAVHFENPAAGMILPIFHLDVKKLLTPSALRQMMATWAQFRFRNPQVMWTAGNADSPGLDRLRKRFGFQFQTNMPFENGIVRKLYVLPPGEMGEVNK